MRDEFYYILRQCLLSRKDWVKYQSNYLRYQSLKAKLTNEDLVEILLYLQSIV